MNDVHWLDNINNSLKPSQRKLRDFGVANPRCGFFLTMGGGKTLTTLATLAMSGQPGHILIIAPTKIADNTWPDELKKWNIPIRNKSLHITEPSFYKNGKPKKPRLLKPNERVELYKKVLDEPSSMYFITLSQVVEVVEWFSTRGGTRKPAFHDWPFRTLILDESQSFKDPKTKRFKALRKVSQYADRVMLLTGTPATESLENLFSQVFLLDGGERLGKTMSAYHETYFYPANNIPGIGITKWNPRKGAEEAIFGRISDIVVHTPSTDLDLKGKKIHDHVLEFTDNEKQAYKEFSKESILDIVIDHEAFDPDNPDAVSSYEDLTDDQIYSLASDNAAVLRGRLLQFAAGSVLMELDRDHRMYTPSTQITSKPTAFIHDHKVDKVHEIITEHMTNGPGTPVLIAHRFIAERERIIERFDRCGPVPAVFFDGTNAMLTAWNNRQIPVMLIHPASAGHGLNLQYGGNTMIWTTLPDSAEQYMQTNARLDRPGQSDEVNIHRIIMKGTVDADTPAALNKKKNTQDHLFKALAESFRK